MSYLFDDDNVMGYPKLQSEIAGSQAIATSKVSPQRLGAAHMGPLLQSFQQMVHPRPNRLRKSLKLFAGRRGKSDHRAIMALYDKKVKCLATLGDGQPGDNEASIGVTVPFLTLPSPLAVNSSR